MSIISLKLKPKDFAIWAWLVLITFVALTNYQIAKLIQNLTLANFPNYSYTWSLSLPWLGLGLVPIVLLKLNSLKFSHNLIRQNFKEIIFYFLLVVIGLSLFVGLGVTKYFHQVKIPFIFFVITPVVEELIFRGWIYDLIKKFTKLNPVVFSAILFGLHHWQYFNFQVTNFAIFQIGYTFILGLLFGKLRERSGMIYLSILLHILINYVSFKY